MYSNFLESVIENRNILDKLFIIDNNKMESKFTSDEFLISLTKNTKSYFIGNKNNILIIYDGNPFITYSILNSLDNCTNVLLFPNYSYLGVNTYLVKNYCKFNDNCRLIVDKNYNKFIHTKELFDEIYVIGDHEMYQLIEEDFPNLKLIEE